MWSFLPPFEVVVPPWRFQHASPLHPSLRLHTPTKQAVVRLNGKDPYRGRRGTPESQARDDRLIAEWLSRGRSLAGPAPEQGTPQGQGITTAPMEVVTITHLLTAYREHGLASITVQ